MSSTVEAGAPLASVVVMIDAGAVSSTQVSDEERPPAADRAAGALPPPSRWAADPVYPGLANGWGGNAWVWFALHAAGLVRDPRGRVVAAIARRLDDERALGVPGPKGEMVSHLVGTGGNALIAARLWAERGLSRRVLARIVQRWERACEATGERDVMLGTAGALLACAEIETVAPGALPPSLVHGLVRRTRAEARRIVANPDGESIGLSHGLAGLLLALESARQVFGARTDRGLVSACRELVWSERIESTSGECFWPERVGGTEVKPHGWCHGSPGVALALLACHAASGEADYRELADGALRGASVDIFVGSGTFCCGTIGRAQVLLEAGRVTGDPRWLAEGRRVAALPTISLVKATGGFHKGTLGALYLHHRLRALAPLPLPGLGALSVAATRA